MSVTEFRYSQSTTTTHGALFMAKSDKKSPAPRAPQSGKSPKAAMSKGAASGAGAIDIGISTADREAIARGLIGLLADTFTLYLTPHNSHWNVTGPMFNTLHVMFMDQYTELWNAVDPIAERIRALGVNASGSFAD